MFNKLIVIFLSIVIGSALSVAQASTRANVPVELAKVENSDSEIKCLEAFAGSKFTFAQPLCLSLAQKGLPDAQLVTGLMYALGEGTKKNLNLARLWLQEALRNGNEVAIEALIDFKLID